MIHDHQKTKCYFTEFSAVEKRKDLANVLYFKKEKKKKFCLINYN